MKYFYPDLDVELDNSGSWERFCRLLASCYILSAVKVS